MPDPSQSCDDSDLINDLRAVMDAPDARINLIRAALILSALDRPGLSLMRYEHHVMTMSDEVRLRHRALLDSGAKDNAATALAALKFVMVDSHDYRGDEDTYDDLQNASLTRVIDRRKGLPVSLSLLAIHLVEAQGWDMQLLTFPAHVICRLDHGGERILCDPFYGFKVCQAADLRQLLKRLTGEQAELSADYYHPSSKRALLIRLQNNIKLRQIEYGDYQAAIKTIERMRILDPDEYRLLFDAGVLYARTHQGLAAIRALEHYLDRAPPKDHAEALLLIRHIRENMN